MWLFIILPVFWSAFPLLLRRGMDYKDLRVTGSGIIGTRSLVFSNEKYYCQIEIRERGKTRFIDRPVKRLLCRMQHDSRECLNYYHPMYVRLVTEKKSEDSCEKRYAEAVNSTMLERILLSYLISQRKDVEILECTVRIKRYRSRLKK
ncbi:MAG: hypothetical protein J6U54_24610 [Clostridiales bacterium]|nr:hypothetical protein [Clostridiales bacterium]